MKRDKRNFYGPNFRILMKLLLRRTLVHHSQERQLTSTLYHYSTKRF